uniref:Retrotransposon protein n=1 Tax=Cucumis melo TaxID=3656 RepID=A0A9I9E9K3_CUCME
MRGPSCSGFGWNEEFQCIIAERDLFDTKGLLHKSFPYYDDLSYVFGKDRATGARSETFPNVGSNVSNMFNDTIPLGDSHDEDIPTMYSQGVHMSPDEMFGIRAGQASERRNCSSVSKRKRGSERYETVEVIRSVMEFGNELAKREACNGGRNACSSCETTARYP